MIFGLPAAVAELLISVGIAFLIALIYKFLANHEEIRNIKLGMKEKQAKLKEFQKTNPSEATKIANEMMALSSKQMRMSMKPMMVTMLLVFITLPFVAGLFPGNVVDLPFTLPFLGSSLTWLWWYMMVSIPFGVLFRKMLGVEL